MSSSADYFLPPVTATAANADSISAKIYEAKELPFDWVKMSRTLHPADWDPQNEIVPIDPSAHWGTQPGKDKLDLSCLAGALAPRGQPGNRSDLDSLQRAAPSRSPTLAPGVFVRDVLFSEAIRF